MAPEVMAGWYQLRYDLAIVVYGRPAPQGSKRHVGKGRMVESSEHLKPWREAVRSEAAAKVAAVREIGPLPTVPITGPVAARMVFTMSAPKSARPGDRPAVEPDLDKLVRGTCDALADAGVIANDKLIVEFDRVAKVYPCWDPESLDRPGAVIRLRRLT
jgi:crossover junction endodeoxyribonuclease RusA